MLAWAQLGMHRKPCGLLNVCGYYDRLIDFLNHTVAERFIRRDHRSMILVADTPTALLQKFQEYRAPVVEKWIDKQDIRP